MSPGEQGQIPVDKPVTIEVNPFLADLIAAIVASHPVSDLAIVEPALEAGATHLLLDNMTPPTLRGAVTLIGGRVPCEASGGVRLETIAAIAATGVTYVSVGRLTQSAPAADIGLDFALAR